MGKDTFDAIMAGMTDALAYAEGDKARGKVRQVRVPTVDVAAARRKLNLSQDQFAAVFGVSVGTLRNWEQGHRQPTGAAKVLMAVIDREPEAVLRVLHR